MASSTTITSKAADGKLHEITIEKTGPDTGIVSLRSWDAESATTSAPSADKSYKLYRIKASADGRRIACKAKAGFFIDPAVSLTAHPAAGSRGPFVQLQIAGGVLGSYEYDVTDAELASVAAFVTESGFPAL